MSIAKRIKEIRKEKKLTQVEFAKTLSVSQSAVSQYEKGQRSPDSAFYTLFAKAFPDLSLHWLLTGEGEMYQPLQPVKVGKFLKLPVVGDIAAGFPIEVLEDEPTEYIEVSTSLLSLAPPYYVFRVEGESMLPVIRPGDYVIISADWRGLSTLNGHICAFRTSDGITLKQYVDDENNKTTWLFPINSTYNPIPFNEYTETCTLIGVLILSIRKY